MIERLAALRSAGRGRLVLGLQLSLARRAASWCRPDRANLVCTTFVAGSLLDAYEQRADTRCLTMASGAADYILDQSVLDGQRRPCRFQLSAARRSGPGAQIESAGGRFAVPRGPADRRREVSRSGFRVARYSAGMQRSDGSWPYGEAPTQHGSTTFTPVSTSALCDLSDAIPGTANSSRACAAGFEFLPASIFSCEMARRATFTIARIRSTRIAWRRAFSRSLEFSRSRPWQPVPGESVCRWAMEHMWDERGFFYYRCLRLCTIRTPYMRWSEAWMFLALAALSVSRTQAAGPGQPRRDALPGATPARTQLVQSRRESESYD